ncbi:IucA/IucC family C-terminal-domain containing protein [Halotalea alkalilenta]|uniref:IucA/IucC family C-terminal-domain containing protein n=1 Tax=Halotalea alkalilenta TaxID=376489 RepID=UPI000488F9FF|nr:IucA/IucC family C-terminal-domain containing protein [Halotalea alkalilenta]
MNAAFTAEEWAVLSGTLRLKAASERDRARSLEARSLLREESCTQVLDRLAPIIGSPSRRITASLLAKRISFLATGACLYAMSVFDKGLTLSLDNAIIEYGHDAGRWTSSMPLERLRASRYPEGQRDAWREEIAGTLFAGLLQPLWQTFYGVTGLPRRILWENTAVRVYSLYEKRMANLDDEATRARCATDFDWLLRQAPAAMFGLDYNPLGHFRRPPTPLDDGRRSIRFRRTCCFYYQATEPAQYCSTCPLLRPRKKR